MGTLKYILSRIFERYMYNEMNESGDFVVFGKS